MKVNRVGTILTADFGSVHTRATLIDVVDGEYRIVARDKGLTTLGFPVDDLHLGLRRLLDQMGEVTGRKFYNQIGRIITPEDSERNGVDMLITTASAGKPIRAVLFGLIPDVSITSALRAMSGSYIEAVATIHLRDGRSEEERLNAILLSRPDLIFIAGGTDGGAKTALLEMLKVLQLALSITDEELRPKILYAGNKSLHAPLQDMFGDLTTLSLSENVRPKMEEESFEMVIDQLDKFYDEHREEHGDAFIIVSDMSSTGLIPTAQSYTLVAEYFAKTRKTNVIAVDMGSTSSVLVGVFNGRSSTRISTSIGLGHSANTLLEEVGEAAIRAWLPFYASTGEIRNYALNKLSRPYTIPMNNRDLFLEHAFLRAGLRQMISEARHVWKGVTPNGTVPPVKMIIAAGSALTGTGNPAFDMLLIADCLQPIGMTEIKTDAYGLIPAMDSIAKQDPNAAVQLLEGTNLEHIGTLISFEGNAKINKRVASLQFTFQDGEKYSEDLMGGKIFVASPKEGDVLKIKIRCARGFSVAGKSSLSFTITGGQGVFLFDGRGRNFNPSSNIAERAELMVQWLQAATFSDEAIQIPEEWLVKPVEVEPVSEAIALKVTQEMSSIEALALDDSVFPNLEPEKEQKKSGKQKAAVVEEVEEEEDDALGSLRDLLN